MPSFRVDRTSEDIKREVIAIMRELKDPRIKGMLTVVRVKVSGDLSYAKVYVSAMEGLDVAKEAVVGLNSAAGYIRREVGNKLHLRKTPEIKFVADDSVEHAIKLFEDFNKKV